jgi:hypothetical protein
VQCVVFVRRVKVRHIFRASCALRFFPFFRTTITREWNPIGSNYLTPFQRNHRTEYLVRFNVHLLSHYNDNVREWAPIAGTKLDKVTEIVNREFVHLDGDED